MNSLSENNENIFGDRLRNYRTVIAQQTQKDFSEFLSIPQPTLSAYESGKNKPTIDVVINIANKCNLSVDWLCGKDKQPHLNSLGNVMQFLFDLYETKEFSCKTVVHDQIDSEDGTETDDEDRNWIQMMFYHCEDKHNPEYKYSQDICAMIKKAYELHSRLVNYDYPQDYYDSEKEKLIEEYKNYPITRINLSGLKEDERLKKRNDIIISKLKNN